MADHFDAPQGPPPPKVPEGWVARWNENYKEWFYVNTYTKKSQWDKPTEPARADEGGPQGPPPGYTPNPSIATPTDTKANPYDDRAFVSNGGAGAGTSAALSEDEKLARQLQAEEDARSRASPYGGVPPGAAAGYVNSPPPQSQSAQPFSNQLPPRSNNMAEKGKGLLGKILGGKKMGGGGHGSSGGFGGLGGLMGGGSHGGQQHGGYGSSAPYNQQPGYGHAPGYGGYGQQPPGNYGGYPPQQGYYPQQGYGGYPPQHGSGFGGYGGHHGPPRKSGPGMGAMAGGAALGVGAGLIGGALVADAISDHDQETYQDGYDAGQMDDGGGDFGGGGDF